MLSCCLGEKKAKGICEYFPLLKGLNQCSTPWLLESVIPTKIESLTHVYHWRALNWKPAGKWWNFGRPIVSWLRQGKKSVSLEDVKRISKLPPNSCWNFTHEDFVRVFCASEKMSLNSLKIHFYSRSQRQSVTLIALSSFEFRICISNFIMFADFSRILSKIVTRVFVGNA